MTGPVLSQLPETTERAVRDAWSKYQQAYAEWKRNPAKAGDVLALAGVEVFAVPMTMTTNGAFGELIRTEIGAAMRGANSAALARIPFIIPEEELPILDTLTLRMKYADGFVAFLNGREVARRNSPAPLEWNSSATSSRRVIDVLIAEEIDLTDHLAKLASGANVLAIQGLNDAASDDGFLISPTNV